jgi:hypothetical protein
MAGFFRYVTKPINVHAFMDTLNEALEFAELGARPQTERACAIVNASEPIA